jgi:hypothetical protein
LSCGSRWWPSGSAPPGPQDKADAPRRSTPKASRPFKPSGCSSCSWPGPVSSVALLVLIAAHHRAISSVGSSSRYGYVHYFVLPAGGALSAGIEVEMGVLTHHSKLGEVAASFTVTVPIAIFVLGIWWIALRGAAGRVVNAAIPVAVVLLDPSLPIPFAITAVVMTLVVAVPTCTHPCQTTPAIVDAAASECAAVARES